MSKAVVASRIERGQGLPSSVAIISSQAFSLVNFRGPLIQEVASKGVTVWALAPDYTEESWYQLERLGAIPVKCSLRRTGVNPVRDLIDIIRLAWTLKQLKPAASLGYFVKPVIFGSVAAWMAGVPRRFALIEGLGFLFRDDENENALSRRVCKGTTVRLYRLALGLCEKVMLLNQDDIDDLSRAGILPVERGTLLGGIGVDLTRFAPVPPVQHPVTFVMVSRMLKEKGVYEFVSAAREVKGEHSHVRFVLVGGPDENPGSVTEGELRAWHATGVVEWRGGVSDVRDELGRASVFALPSYYREGVPRSTQEAMAMARPVITTDRVGCRETVVQGVNGFVIPARDPKALAAAMRRFIDEPSLIGSMGKASRELAEERFDVQVVNRRTLAALAGR